MVKELLPVDDYATVAFESAARWQVHPPDRLRISTFAPVRIRRFSTKASPSPPFTRIVSLRFGAVEAFLDHILIDTIRPAKHVHNRAQFFRRLRDEQGYTAAGMPSATLLCSNTDCRHR